MAAGMSRLWGAGCVLGEWSCVRGRKRAVDQIQGCFVVQTEGAVVEISGADRGPKIIDEHQLAVIHRRLELEEAHATFQ